MSRYSINAAKKRVTDAHHEVRAAKGGRGNYLRAVDRLHRAETSLGRERNRIELPWQFWGVLLFAGGGASPSGWESGPPCICSGTDRRFGSSSG